MLAHSSFIFITYTCDWYDRMLHCDLNKRPVRLKVDILRIWFVYVHVWIDRYTERGIS